MAAILAFELSGDYAVVLPLVLGTALATTIARVLNRDSIYTSELRARGVDLRR
jgi:CIC family chloride channel protein